MKIQAFSITAVLIASVAPTAVNAAAQGTVQGTNVFINSGGINTNHLANDAINSGKVQNGSLQGADLADDTLLSAQIGANAIGASELGNASVDNAAIQEGAVSTSKLADNAVNTGKIANGTILSADIANGTITGANMANGTVNGANIANATITSANIANGAISTNHLSSDIQLQLQKLDGIDNDIDRGDAMAMSINAIPYLAGKKHSFGFGSASVGDSEAVSAGYRFHNRSNFSASIAAAFAEGEKAVSGGVAWGF